MSDHAGRVADYYDNNTRRFVRFGEGSSQGAIHRGIWLDGIDDPLAAADTVNRLMIERLRDHVPAKSGHILDLGCGVGATMMRLATALDVAVTGVTISRVQADLAHQHFITEGVADRCQVLCADFAELPPQPRYDAIIAIEAVIHSPAMNELIPMLAARLKPGGRLIICDDWLTEPDTGANTDDGARAECLRQFRAGWRIGSLHTPTELSEFAQRAGLTPIDDRNLSPYLHLGRPRDRVMSILRHAAMAVPALGQRVLKMPYWGNIIGGNALQAGLARGWIEYRIITFERPLADPISPGT